MRNLFTFVAALLIAGCTARIEQPIPQTPATTAPAKKELSADLIGATAADLMRVFGTPALQVREGPGLKLQFRGRSCVLDAYLYPPQQGAGAERVTYVDARSASGASTDGTQCALSLTRP